MKGLGGVTTHLNGPGIAEVYPKTLPFREFNKQLFLGAVSPPKVDIQIIAFVCLTYIFWGPELTSSDQVFIYRCLESGESPKCSRGLNCNSSSKTRKHQLRQQKPWHEPSNPACKKAGWKKMAYEKNLDIPWIIPPIPIIIQSTPWKINMETTNHPFRKEIDLPNLHDYVPC